MNLFKSFNQSILRSCLNNVIEYVSIKVFVTTYKLVKIREPHINASLPRALELKFSYKILNSLYNNSCMHFRLENMDLFDYMNTIC